MHEVLCRGGSGTTPGTGAWMCTSSSLAHGRPSRAGADTATPDADGITPLEAAEGSFQVKVTDILKSQNKPTKSVNFPNPLTISNVSNKNSKKKNLK